MSTAQNSADFLRKIETSSPVVVEFAGTQSIRRFMPHINILKPKIEHNIVQKLKIYEKDIVQNKYI